MGVGVPKTAFNAASQAHVLSSFLRQLQSTANLQRSSSGAMRQGSMDTDAKSAAERLHQLATALAESLTARRYFMAPVEGEGEGGGWRLDPRFLVMEYIFNILLRERQVEMVEWFVDNVKNGQVCDSSDGPRRCCVVLCCGFAIW